MFFIFYTDFDDQNYQIISYSENPINVKLFSNHIMSEDLELRNKMYDVINNNTSTLIFDKTVLSTKNVLEFSDVQEVITSSNIDTLKANSLRNILSKIEEKLTPLRFLNVLVFIMECCKLIFDGYYFDIATNNVESLNLPVQTVNQDLTDLQPKLQTYLQLFNDLKQITTCIDNINTTIDETTIQTEESNALSIIDNITL